MAGNGKPPVLVVVQLTGGNDFMNTLIPYTSPVYYDSRPTVHIPQDQVLPIDDTLAFHPRMGPFKELYDQGKVAVIQGIGYPNSSRSHFRGMDILHTCEPDKIATEGWLGKTTRELDPNNENVLTAVNFGVGLPRALVAPGVPVSSVGDLDNYGIMTGISEEQQRNEALETFKTMYGPAVGSGPVMEYLAQTGMDVLRGADRLNEAPGMYSSDVEYADNAIARNLRDIARVHLAGLGTRIFYASQGGYDVHANENPTQPKLIGDLSGAIMDFFQDLRDHEASDEVVMLVFTEFGRRNEGQRQRHRPRIGRWGVHHRRPGRGWTLRRVSASGPGPVAQRPRTSVTPSTSEASTVPSWSSGYRLRPPPIVSGDYEQVRPFATV